MKLLKLGLISIVGLFLLMTAMSLLLPSEVVISRAIDIDQPADSVFAMVSDLATWHLWMDQFDTGEIKISKMSRGPGARLSMNEFSVRITDTVANKISAVWQNGKSRPLHGSFTIFAAENRTGVTLQWQFVQHLRWYPWEKFASIVTDKVLGPTMEKSLDNLKTLVS